MIKKIGFIFFALILSGCATKLVEEPSTTLPATMPLKNFDSIVIQEASLKPPYSGQAANEKATRKINELMLAKMKSVFGDAKIISAEQAKGKTNVLTVSPEIKQIKFIGGGARFFAGAMAGSSVVVMDVNFVEAETGKLVARTGAYRKGNAYAGGWSMGATDNVMLEQVVDDVVSFARSNY